MSKERKKENLVVFCNSWPKSGTHLLLNMMTRFFGEKGLWYKDNAVKSPPNETDTLFKMIECRLDKYKTNFAMKGHIGYTEEIAQFLRAHNIKVLFIVRDPRDIVCSTIRWVTDLRQNWEANEFFSKLNKEEQLSYAINGMPDIAPFNNMDSFVLWQKPIKERYQYITPWANSKDACLIKYEDLSGNNGVKDFNSSIQKISHFLSLNEKDILGNFNSGLIDKTSQTFHTGNSGDWKDEFSWRNYEEFIAAGGEELVSIFNYKPSRKYLK